MSGWEWPGTGRLTIKRCEKDFWSNEKFYFNIHLDCIGVYMSIYIFKVQWTKNIVYQLHLSKGD